jgi:tRNA 2-thiouridine synthesizing protein A
MAFKVLDTVGLKSPGPIVKIALTFADMKRGDILEVWGDCPVFEKDVRYWCTRIGKNLVSVKEDIPPKKKIQIEM